MIVLLLAALSVIALMMLTVLHASVWLSLLSLLCCAGGITLWILRHKLPAAAVIGGGIVCILASAAVLVPAGNGAGSIKGYTTVLEDAKEALEEGKYEKAQLLIQRAEEAYGVDDQTRYLTAIRMTAQKEYEGAHEVVEQMTDHTSELYYTVKEQIYIQDPSEETIDDMCALYLAAAKDHPDWTYMQKKAGIAQLQQKNYKSAIYFLENAVLQDTEDPEIYYYLGIANYYMSDYETANSCFAHAIEYGLADEHSSDLLWYIKQMEQVEEED